MQYFVPFIQFYIAFMQTNIIHMDMMSKSQKTIVNR